MKRLLCIGLCVLFFSFGVGENIFAQLNLVPNPSFETYTNCPTSGSQINYAFPWYSPTGGSPDYFNGCVSSYSVGVPLNWGGYQYAKTGIAYAGIYCYGSNLPYPDIKEYLQVKLTDSLIQNKKYCVSFYVNLAKPPSGSLTYNNVAITEIGMYISDTAVSEVNEYTLPYIAQIQSPSGVFLNDTVNWTEISGTYTAHGGEKYITIGNFNSHTDTMGIVHYNNYSASYYYIDDVSVVDCTDMGVGELGITNEELGIIPNPSQGMFEVKSDKYKIQSIEVFNVLGEKIYYEEIKDITATINLQAPPGVYFIQVQTEKGILRKKFVKE